METSDQEKVRKIESLREMITSAERTIQGAKAMLLQLEGKKKAGRRRKIDDAEEGARVVHGAFDGQLMIGGDGKQYPVPANYASKSKLVEGDMLKLTITDDGSFIYKQVGPADRKHAIGVVTQDENGNHFIVADGKPYRVLLASITYFKASVGDEVAMLIPREGDAQWAAIENILQKASGAPSIPSIPTFRTPPKTYGDDMEISTANEKPKEDTRKAFTDAPDGGQKSDTKEEKGALELLDEWRADIEEIEKEMERK